MNRFETEQYRGDGQALAPVRREESRWLPARQPRQPMRVEIVERRVTVSGTGRELRSLFRHLFGG